MFDGPYLTTARGLLFTAEWKPALDAIGAKCSIINFKWVTTTVKGFPTIRAGNLVFSWSLLT